MLEGGFDEFGFLWFIRIQKTQPLVGTRIPFVEIAIEESAHAKRTAFQWPGRNHSKTFRHMRGNFAIGVIVPTEKRSVRFPFPVHNALYSEKNGLPIFHAQEDRTVAIIFDFQDILSRMLRAMKFQARQTIPRCDLFPERHVASQTSGKEYDGDHPLCQNHSSVLLHWR